MKGHFAIILNLFSIYLYSSCTNNRIDRSPIATIDIESNVLNKEQINLSRFTNTIRYVSLATNADMIFTGIWDCEFSDSLILIKNLGKCLLYDFNGNFISKIGNKGRGPGEFQYANKVEFGPKKKIYVQSMYDLFEYNIDGSFSENYKNSFLLNNEFVSRWASINDTFFLGKIASLTGKEKYKGLVFNKQGDIKYYFNNYTRLDRHVEMSNDGDEDANIYIFNDIIIFKEVHNDTLFHLTEQYKLNPIYIFHLGKFKEPDSERARFFSDKDQSKIGYYIRLDNVFQTSDYLFLECFMNDHFPAKRLTPKRLLGDRFTWYNSKHMLGLFNKLTGELVFCEPTSTDNPLFTSGLYNDIDAGPRFFPKKMVNDSTMAMWVEAKQLKDHVASDDFKNSVSKCPEKKKQLEELANKLTEFDNPVLMFLTFNK